MAKNVLLAATDLADIIRERPALLTQLCNEVSGMVEEGNLRPATPLNVFQGFEVEQALCFFQDRERCGKIVIELSHCCASHLEPLCQHTFGVLMPLRRWLLTPKLHAHSTSMPPMS